MILKVSCTCGHAGITSDARLPCELRCWRCGSSRRVETDHGMAIISRDRFEEWLAAERERPRAREEGVLYEQSTLPEGRNVGENAPEDGHAPRGPARGHFRLPERAIF